MKAIVISAAIILLGFICTTTSLGTWADENGQPGCKTDAELETKVFRNFWDPTVYWECEELNQAASRVKCPDQTAFLDSVKKCVGWNDWVWEELVQPLSSP